MFLWILTMNDFDVCISINEKCFTHQFVQDLLRDQLRAAIVYTEYNKLTLL